MDALPVIATIAVAVISALGAYLAAAKRLSGKIATSEADSLWQESKAIRDDYREQLASAGRRQTASDERQARLEERIARLEEQNSDLAAENVRLMREALDCATTVARLRDERDALQAEVADLQSTIRGRRADDGTT